MLPARVGFEGAVGLYRYRKIAHRAPRAGEYYLSGARVYAYRARTDFTTAYIVVEPLDALKRGYDFNMNLGA
jgi:hypothetical protein